MLNPIIQSILNKRHCERALDIGDVKGRTKQSLRAHILFVLLAILFNFVFSNETMASQPDDIRHTNISGGKVTVSWMTTVTERGYINYGTTSSLGNTAYDIRGELFEGTIHYVTISDLNPNTIYYYDVVSGGVTYDNSGAHYTITTGTKLSPATGSDIAYGQVFLSDGTTPAEGAIVYIKLMDNDGSGTSGDSQLRSSPVGDTGYWYLDLKNIRTKDLDAYFDYSASGDKLVLEAKGTDGKLASQIVDTSTDSPAPSMKLELLTLGLTIDRTNWPLLNIQTGSMHITDNATKIQVTNVGNGPQTYSLAILNEGGIWSAASDKDGAELNKFVLSTIFTEDSKTGVDSTYFNEIGSDDVMLKTLNKATADRFGSTKASQGGVYVIAGEKRNLWLEFKAPTKDTTAGATQTIKVTISAEVP